MNFAKLLHKFRSSSSTGMTRTDLARAIGVHPSYIMQIEKGSNSPPPVDRVKDIAKALKLEPEQTDQLIYASVNERWNTELGEVERIFRTTTSVLDSVSKQMGDDVQDYLSYPKKKDPKIRKIPLISWVRAGQLETIVDEFPPGWADDWVYTSKKGPHMYALTVDGDSMSPKFQDGDVILVDPDLQTDHNDYVIVRDSYEDKATFKQLRKVGNNILLHPLNPAYEDIILDGSKRWEISGKVVQRIENL